MVILRDILTVHYVHVDVRTGARYQLGSVVLQLQSAVSLRICQLTVL